MNLRAFLRYNSRHHLWLPRGYKGRYLPQLDPIESIYDGTWRLSLYEPLWLFRLRQRVFCHAGRHRCPDRGASVFGRQFGGDKPLPDTWDVGPDANRTCSYCGSIHPDDLMAICRKTLIDRRYSVEGTDKAYKVYVRQPGVRNASEGAIKFYKWHAPRDASREDQDLFASAVRVSHQRFMEQFATRKPMAAS